jgi:hypothetical protein
MPRRPPGSREVIPSREATGDRRGPSFGPKLNVSVPISFGLPLIVVGAVLIAAALSTDRIEFWVLGGLGLVVGAALFASGKRL